MNGTPTPTIEPREREARLTTTTVPITITCPDWCTIAPTEHAADLWNFNGNCIHWMEPDYVEDPEGLQGALAEPRFLEPIRVQFTTTADPLTGRESASPVILLGRLHAEELTVGQALALADALRSSVELYRAAGGVA